MIHSSRQLKDLIRNLSKSTGVDAYILMRQYMMERFLERVSKSQYRNNFIIKGGILVASLLGVNQRTTMDIDTTIKGFTVTISEIQKLIEDIISIPIDDDVVFYIKKYHTIMEDMDYPGVRVSLDAVIENSIIPLQLDISTGDIIMPGEVQYSYELMFEKRSISLMAYTLETVLAEKLETIIARATNNTRMRDFYDIAVLYDVFLLEINQDTLSSALLETAKKRGSDSLLNNVDAILCAIANSHELSQFWSNFQNKYEYAKALNWEKVLKSVRDIAIDAGLPVKEVKNIKQTMINKKGHVKEHDNMER